MAMPQNFPTRDALEQEITLLSVRMIELKTELNSRSPCAALPPEIFSEIFMQAAGIHSEDYAVDQTLPAIRDLVRASHVCKQWRAIALGCPALWACIDLNRPSEWVAELLARSKGAPLYVSMNCRKRSACTSPTRKRWMKDSLGMALACLGRIRELKLIVTPKFSEAQEVLKLLDGPAPLLESLTIDDMFSRSRVEEHTSGLLNRAESRGLRRLHLRHCDTVSWEGIALGNLTHLNVENHTRYMGLPDFLGALSRMPRLEELLVAGALTLASHDNDKSVLLSPTPVALPQLRSLQVLRGYVTASACLLDNLATPTLSHLSIALQLESVYESQDTDAASHAVLLPAMAAKVPTLGKFLTLVVERHPGSNTTVKAYSEAFVTNTDGDLTSWLDARVPVLQLTSHALVDEATFEAFCALFPIDDALSLVLRGGIPSRHTWSSLAERTTLVRELHVLNVGVTNPIADRLLEQINEEPERASAGPEGPIWHYALPSLRVLVLDRVYFEQRARCSGDSDSRGRTVDRLADCLVQRYKSGADIGSVRILGARYVTDQDFKSLLQTVRVAGYGGELQIDGRLEGNADLEPALDDVSPELDDVEEEWTDEEDSEEFSEDDEISVYL